MKTNQFSLYLFHAWRSFQAKDNSIRVDENENTERAIRPDSSPSSRVPFDFVGIAKTTPRRTRETVRIVVGIAVVRGIIPDYLSANREPGKSCSYRCKVDGNADEAIKRVSFLSFHPSALPGEKKKKKKGKERMKERKRGSALRRRNYRGILGVFIYPSDRFSSAR